MPRKPVMRVVAKNKPHKPGGTVPFSGAYADLSRRNVDQRTVLARAMNTLKEDLFMALAEDVTPQERIIIDRIIYKVIRITLIEAAFLRGDEVRDDIYTGWTNSLRSDLMAIGLGRREKTVKLLEEYLKQEAREELEPQKDHS